MSTFLRRPFAAALAALIASVGANQASADMYFSEYIEGSSNNKALEIYNSGSSEVDLASYKVEMYFNGSASAGLTINLSGKIPALGTFVLAHGSANSSILAKANQTNSAGWFNGDDAILLKNGNTIIDSIGQVDVDPGTEWGTGLTSTADNTLRRKTSVTTGDNNTSNSFDPALEWEGFATDTTDNLGSYQASSNGGGGGNNSACGSAATRISSIQGSSSASSFVGQNVSVEAVVVASFQGANQIGGFFLQETDANSDGNPATSEGIFVSSTQAVNVGDLVRVSGAVAETFQLTQLTPSNITVCASNQTLPTAATLQLPLNSATALEAMEAMRVSVPQTLTVSETYGLGRYGQILLSNGRLQQPTNVTTPGAAALALQAQHKMNQLLLDDASNVQNPDPVIFPAPGLSANNSLRGGDTVANLSGVLTYDFGEYRLLPTSTPNFVHSNPRSTSPATITGSNLRVASFNVLNFFNGDGLGGGFPTARGANTATEFARQKAKIVSAILGLNADIVGLTELENDGYGSYSAIAELVNSLNSASNSNAWIYVNPGVSNIGTDQIAIGFIYRTDRASTLGTPAILDSSIEPLFIDNKNRPTLAQTFRATQGGGVITIAINHLKSKGSDCNDLGDADTGDGQGNCNITRTQAAQALLNWISRNPTGINDKDYLLIGDFNAYSMENPITTLTSNGFTDLTRRFEGDSAYSYVFDGQAGSLDHGLASTSLNVQVLGASDWHINADEPISLDYNTEFKSANQLNSFYASNAYRSSDHDPLVISLKLVVDLDGDGDVDSKDVKIITDARNTRINGFDQRDLNRDGIIDATDVRLLSLQCTRVGCATE